MRNQVACRKRRWAKYVSQLAPKMPMDTAANMCTSVWPKQAESSLAPLASSMCGPKEVVIVTPTWWW